MFEAVTGNDPVKAYLKKALDENRLPHALLFAGPEGSGKRLLAKALATHLLNADPARIESENHPDLHIVRPEGKSGLHAIDELRALISSDALAPYVANCKVFIIESAERMQPAAANTLLKTLEEPSDEATFILISSSPQEILPTIRSRCQTIQFHSLAIVEGGFESLFEVLAAELPFWEIEARLEKIQNLIDEEKEDDPTRASKRADDLFLVCLMWYRDQHLRSIDPAAKTLFFPEAASKAGALPPLEKIEAAIENARDAFRRNIKLSTCLLHVILY